MRAGKLAPDKLERLVLGRFAHRRTDVLVPACLGEDSTVIDFGDEVCILSTDPITGAAKGAGRLAVHVSCNDIASNGGRPVGVQVVLLLPETVTEDDISTIMDGVESGCAELGIQVLGGHTEITSKVLAPIIVTTAVGRAAKDRYVTSSGSKPGDCIVVTKSVGLEGTAILASDWSEHLLKPELAGEETEARDLLKRASRFIEEISAVSEGILAAEYGVSAMHDVTEGGLYGGIWEMSKASGLAFRVQEKDVPVRPETAYICERLQLDPLGLISSGTMMITCFDGAGLVKLLGSHGIPASVIGEVVTGGASILIKQNGEEKPLLFPPEDELWRFLAQQDD